MRPDPFEVITRKPPVVQPSWCPWKACVPYFVEYGPDEVGGCVGIDLTGSENPSDYIRLCNKVNGGKMASANMTTDEAARLGGGLACVAGIAILLSPPEEDLDVSV